MRLNRHVAMSMLVQKCMVQVLTRVHTTANFSGCLIHHLWPRSKSIVILRHRKDLNFVSCLDEITWPSDGVWMVFLQMQHFSFEPGMHEEREAHFKFEVGHQKTIYKYMQHVIMHVGMFGL